MSFPCTTKKLLALTALPTLALVSGLAPFTAQAADSLTGNISVVSKYVLRGVTPPKPGATESDGPAMQGGFDFAGESGIYLGYWGSNLGYGNDVNTGFENDFYGGYSGKAGDFSYSAGLIQYWYLDIDNSDGLELVGTVGYGPVNAGLKYLTKDVAWGNQGDIYWTFGYSTTLPKDFTFGATLGYYTYKKDGKYIPTSTESSGYRHLDLSLSHPVGKTGAVMSVTYTNGGKDRQGTELRDAIVFGLKYGFDI